MNRKITFIPVQWIAVCGMVLAGIGCAGPTLAPAPNLYWATGVHPFDDVPEAFRVTSVDIIYATDRIPEENSRGELEYGYGRSHSLAVGLATIEMGNDLTWEELVEASTTRRRKQNVPLELTEIRELVRLPPSNTPLQIVDGTWVENPDYVADLERSTEQVIQVLQERLAMTSVKEIYVYIHGYNNSFEFASYRMATLWHYLGRQGVPILYSWPAGHPGMLQGYTYDRESSEFTIFHVKQLFKIIMKCPDLKAVHVIGHSRGTDVVLTTMRELWLEMRSQGQTEAKLLGNVVIAAADIDWDVLQQRYTAERVIMGLENFVFYLSEEDKAISFSSWLFGSVARIGQLGISLLTPQQRESVEEQKHLQIIDAKVRKGFVGHAYFIDNPAVLSDIILVLRDGLPAGAEYGRPLKREKGGFWTITDDYLIPKP